MITTKKEKETNETHAPSHLREQFQEWLDSYQPDQIQDIDIRPVAPLLDALENCGDVLPADYCDQLEIPKGSSYAEAVEEVRQWHAERKRIEQALAAEAGELQATGHPEIIRIIRENESEDEELARYLADTGGKRKDALADLLGSKSLEELKTVAWELTEAVHKERMACRLMGENTPFLWDCLNSHDLVCWLIGDRIVTEKYKDRLERHEREMALLDAGDADGLYEEGFVDEQERDEYRRWFGPASVQQHGKKGCDQRG